MSLRVAVCGSCGKASFPPPFLCPACGAREWREEEAASGTLEAVADRGEVRLGAVRLPQGPLAIARVEGDAEAGAEVSLSEDGDVPVARA
ncbi:MAG: zinc ribbon domain-containing protein [Gaiella sp.]|nr:zinc ribbon domain-containing protein [Gaiella sp.]